MQLDNVKKISVIGSGIMGHGIAQTFALAGYTVSLYDLSQEILERAMKGIKANLELFVETGLTKAEEAKAALTRIRTETDLAQAVGESDFVIEAIPEVLERKKELFKTLDELTPSHTILATNTSALSGSAMAEVTKRPQQVVVTHWFNPPHLVPVVEVVKGTWTSEETLTLAAELMRKIGKKPVVIRKEIPGFVANRIQGAIMREALKILKQGVASMADIDQAIKGGPGFRLASLGIFEIADMGGLDTWASASAASSDSTLKSNDAVRVLQEKVRKGELGLKTGKGFYDYTGVDIDKLIEKRDRTFIRRLKEEGD
jgi:3-hydroxyacyl-CoA dehydrogenase